MRKLLAPLLCLAAFTLALAALHRYYVHRYPGGDPDRYYHYAVSKLTLEKGLLRVLPQVQGVGWDRYFPDKEFLFHMQTALGYRLGGERGVRVSIALVALAFSFLLAWQLAQALGWLPGALFVAGLALSNPYFSPRLLLVRPHTLAVLCALILLLGLCRRSRALAGLGALLFALAYHALYVPFAFAGAALFFALPRERKLERQVALFAFGGLLIGTVAHPYFPANVGAMLEQMRIGMAFSGGESAHEAGAELLALSPRLFLTAFYPQLLALLAAVAALFLRARDRKDLPYPLLLTASLALLFWLLALRSPRACEYAIPLSLLSLGYSLPLLGLSGSRLVAAAAAAAILPGSYLGLQALAAAPEVRREAFHNSIFDAIAAVPESDPEPVLLTCNWYFGSFVIHARPEARFTNVMHPMRFDQPVKYALIEAMAKGEVPDLQGAARAFGARYVLCDDPRLNERLRLHPSFHSLFVPNTTQLPGEQYRSPVRLFSVDTEPPKAFVHAFDFSLFTAESLSESELPKADPRFLRAEHAPPFLNLFLAPGAAPAEQGYSCGWLRPSAGEMARLAGAELLALGGGPHLRAWWNGKPLFATGLADGAPKLMSAMVPIPSGKLKASDRLDIFSCRKNSVYWGLAASFWTRSELEQRCRGRRDSPSPEPAGFAFSDEGRFSCFAPLVNSAR